MADLTDKEITELCARAMGFEGAEQFALDYFCDYNPLQDDAQAMALVKKLRLNVDQSNPDEYAVYGSKHATTYGGFSKDLNRAICLCAARVQIEKEKNANG